MDAESQDRHKEAGIAATEINVAELIIQLASEDPSHLLVPTVPKNQAENRGLFMRTRNVTEVSDDPRERVGWGVSRKHLLKYEDHLKVDHYLLMVHGDDQTVKEARTLLRDTNAEDIRTHTAGPVAANN